MKINGSLQNDPARIIITGGGSLFIPLQKELENIFFPSVEVLDLIRLKQLEIEENIRSKCPPQIMNTAIAAAMRIFSGRKSFNFRQGEFAAKNIRLNLKGQLKWAAIIAGIIFFLAIVNQVLDYSLKTKRLNSIKKQISLIFKKDFPKRQTWLTRCNNSRPSLPKIKRLLVSMKGLPETTVLNY